MHTEESIPIRGVIRLGQFLKLTGCAEDGIHARELIQEAEVTVNDQVETRRGRQLHSGDRVGVDTPQGRLVFRVAPASD